MSDTTISRILCVDDEANILKTLIRVFRTEPVEIIVNTNPVEALGILKQQPVSIVISDYRMEPLNGLEFLKRVEDLCPNAVRVILSGYAQDRLIETALNEGAIHHFVSKPFRAEDFKNLIRSILEKSEPETRRVI